MSLNEAQVHCSRILEKSQFSSKCREFLGDMHDALQKNCIDDVKVCRMFVMTICENYLLHLMFMCFPSCYFKKSLNEFFLKFVVFITTTNSFEISS